MAKFVTQVGPVVVCIKDDRAKLTKKTARVWAAITVEAAEKIAEFIGAEEVEEDTDG